MTSIAVTAIIGIIWISSLVAVGVTSSPDTAQVEKTPSPLSLMFTEIKGFFNTTGSQLAQVGSSFNFAESGSTTSKAVATSSDGSIGISTTDNNADNSNINSLTE